MNIKELIDQKKMKKILAKNQTKEKNILNSDKNMNEDKKSKTKSPKNGDNYAVENYNVIPTKKVNNVPCDHSDFVYINPDTISHIKVKDKKECTKECSDRPCTFLCPSHVYGWTQKGLRVDYQYCIECGACYIFCPRGNIDWNYPRSGYGIVRKY